MHEFRHIPVLGKQVIRAINPRPGQTIVDCTVGLGGHAAMLLKATTPGPRIIGLDMDRGHLDLARPVLEATGGKFSLHHGNFAGLEKLLAAEGVEKVDAILADVGVASPQIDDPARGFSYRKPGPLDMRMDASRGQPASTLVNRIDRNELAQALKDFGDEEDADAIADLIVERRKQQPIMTTDDLTAIVCEARDFTLQRANGAKLHPAARTFQVLRMLVNREIPNIERLLTIAPKLLKPRGVIAIISFHSGEDRRVKHFFREGLRENVYEDISRDPIIATDEERLENPRSRSAKLRWARTGKESHRGEEC